MPVLVSALFAPTKDLHFQTLHPRSFHFICNLHRYKRCTVLEGAPNLQKFSLTAQCEFEADGVVSGPSSSVRFLHRPKVYLFTFSIVLASFSCAPCIGANIVPS